MDLATFQAGKILVSRLSAVGDVVRTVPAVCALRRRFPHAVIHWLVEDRCAGMIDGLSCVDELRLVPRREWKKTGSWARLRSFRAFIRSLRAERYDLYVDYHGILKSGLYGWLARIPVRVGYPKGIAKEMNTLFNNTIIHAEPGRMSRYERNFLMTRAFDPSAEETRPELPLGPDARAFADRWLVEQGLADRPFAFLYPGTSPRGRYKRWMPDRYGRLADLLAAEGMPAVIGWGPGEEPIVSELTAAAAAPCRVLPLTSLKELAAVIERARVFIGGDTGPMHMASLVGTPVVTIFGPSDPVINEPARFTPFRIVTAGVDCAPCRKKTCTTLDCLTAISPETVRDAVRELMATI